MRISDWSSDVCSSDLTKRVNCFARAQSGCLRSFVAAIAKIPDLMPLPPGFCFITGFGPATRTLEKIAGALGQPLKVVALVHNHHGTATIDRKSVVEGKSGSILVNPGGRRIIKQ